MCSSRALRLSPSTLVSHLDNKQRVLDLVTTFVGADVVQAVERSSIHCGLDAAVPDDDLGRDVLLAVTYGLWVARCSRTEPMSVDAAREVLRHTGRALGVRPADDAA